MLGHLSADKVINQLQHAYRLDLGSKRIQLLERIRTSCTICQIYAQQPKKTRTELPEDKDLKQLTIGDSLYTDEEPVLHEVNKTATFQNTK